jgi:quinol-cytochrome oxidoreductase complex cytochrome b subunit
MSTWAKSRQERPRSTPASGELNRSRARATANNAILHLHPAKVPAAALRFTYTWGLGGISALLAVMLTATGVLLMFRYEPSADSAYTSIQVLESQVAFGSLFRAVHHWSANLLFITTFLHLVRVFLTGGYKRGRAWNWMVGVALLVVVAAFNFTGYLLPWDQLAYWAITICTSLISYIPLVGPVISKVVLGGNEIGQGALSNFYALHVAVLPALMVPIMGYHFWKVRKDGGISQPLAPGGQRPERVTTIPNLVQREFAVAAVVFAAVLIFAMLVPAPLEDIADPLHPPNPAKAAWYFVGLQELLLHMHALAAMALVAIVLLVLVIVPLWDRKGEDIGIYFRSAAGRRAGFFGAVLGFYLVPLLVVADEFWVDLPALVPPHWPILISGGLLPLLLTLAGLAAIYLLCRMLSKAKHGEALVGLYSALLVGFVMLTIIGNLFRGPNMALVLPF